MCRIGTPLLAMIFALPFLQHFFGKYSDIVTYVTFVYMRIYRIIIFEIYIFFSFFLYLLCVLYSWFLVVIFHSPAIQTLIMLFKK